jgi:5-methylcytosine-specific restriction enzyme A
MSRMLPSFDPGSDYSRKDVFDLLGLVPRPSGGNWFTGYQSYGGAHFIFCNVGTAGRTGHRYANRWEGPDTLRWYGKTRSTADQPQIIAMTSGRELVYVFHRSDNQDRFTFAGLAEATEVQRTQPVEILWRLVRFEADVGLAEEVDDGAGLIEGAVRQIVVNAYERNGAARRECVRHYGPRCLVCGFDFKEAFGALGHNYIHVHHVIPLASIGQEYRVDPINDLRPVCPNCHSVSSPIG